jgi:hypothetical protein
MGRPPDRFVAPGSEPSPIRSDPSHSGLAVRRVDALSLRRAVLVRASLRWIRCAECRVGRFADDGGATRAYGSLAITSIARSQT